MARAKDPALQTKTSPLAVAMCGDDEPIFHPNTGTEIASGEEIRLSPSQQAGYDAPRFCQLCGRRMKVQIRPDGWHAECSRHGLVDSEWIFEAQLRRRLGAGY